jgi:hypothetical protein
MKADGRRGNREVVQQLLRLACVLAGDAAHLLEDFKSTQGDVAKVADRRGDQIKTGSERSLGHCLQHGSASRHPPNASLRIIQGKTGLRLPHDQQSLSLEGRVLSGKF